VIKAEKKKEKKVENKSCNKSIWRVEVIEMHCSQIFFR